MHRNSNFTVNVVFSDLGPIWRQDLCFLLDCPKMYFHDFQKTYFLDIFFKFWNSDLKISDKLSFCLKNKWQKSEEQLRKRYSTRIDFVSLLLEILLGSF